jgi:hypothetical protein
LPPHSRKLLGFTDNRQDAALQAGHFNDFLFVATRPISAATPYLSPAAGSRRHLRARRSRSRRFAERLPWFDLGHSICNWSQGDAEVLAEAGRRQIEAMAQWHERNLTSTPLPPRASPLAPPGSMNLSQCRVRPEM